LLHQLKTVPVKHKLDDCEPVENEFTEIEDVTVQEEHQLELVVDYYNNDDTLEDKLEKFEQTVISSSSIGIPLANRLLRPAMIAALCEFKPISKSEFLEMVPAYLRNSTASEQGGYLEQVLNIISASEQELSIF
jgi:hypothetical protein